MEVLETVVQWRVENFFDMLLEGDYFVEAKKFSLADSEWFLEIHADQETMENSPSWISLFLCKESAGECRVAFRLEIKKIDGSVLKACTQVSTFNEWHDELGQYEFIKRSDLLKAKSEVSVNGALTVLCSARILNGSMVSSTTEDAFHFLLPVVKTVEPASQTPDGISTLIENFKDLYISKRNADVKIIVKGRELLAHRTVLSARSTVFASMFNSDMAEKNSGVVEITDCDPDSFESFLLFLYTGKLDVVCASNATSLYETSDKYDLKELKEECIRCMINELTIDSVCDVFQIAVTYNDIVILEASTKFFLENAKHILVTLKWQKFSEENHTFGNELFLKYVNKYTK